MKIKEIRSDEIYKKMLELSPEKKDDMFRYELLKPFEFKYKCIGAPLKSSTPGGYDAVMAVTMGGSYGPCEINESKLKEIEAISNDNFWTACKDSIENTLKEFEDHGIELKVKDYVFTILLNDKANPISNMTGDYCGDGGIPGYIIGTIIPNETSLKMLPVALAHETNHNIRWQYMTWNPNITLGDMIVSEGLAENWAGIMFGEDKVGIWVKNTTEDTLNNVIKPLMKANLHESDFSRVSSYLYGDDIMSLRGGQPLGVPYCAGYACGYALIKYYLKKTGKTIYEATITSTEDILKEVEDFWN